MATPQVDDPAAVLVDGVRGAHLGAVGGVASERRRDRTEPLVPSPWISATGTTSCTIRGPPRPPGRAPACRGHHA
jgi:hypothetical protein